MCVYVCVYSLYIRAWMLSGCVYVYVQFLCLFIALLPLRLQHIILLSRICLYDFFLLFYTDASQTSVFLFYTTVSRVSLPFPILLLPVFYFNTSKVPLLGFLIDFSQDSFPSFHTSATQVPFPFSILISSVTLFYINVSQSSSSFRFLN